MLVGLHMGVYQHGSSLRDHRIHIYACMITHVDIYISIYMRRDYEGIMGLAWKHLVRICRVVSVSHHHEPVRPGHETAN